MITVVLATSNAGKVVELSRLLAGLPIQLVGVKDVLGHALDIPEHGETFEANAVEKARVVCRATRLISLADDSGLEVDALDGRPGVRSARFAHDRATDAENNAELLRALEEIDERRARFRCVLALATPWSEHVATADGRCEGHIARVASGAGGFGYDPLFVLDGEPPRTMAELSPEEKNTISHRGRAAAALRELLRETLARQLDEAERFAG